MPSFAGTVVSKEVVGRGIPLAPTFRFAVDRAYKGAVFSEQIVASRHDEGACGLDPDVGSTWVIFAIDGIEGQGDRAVNRLITTLQAATCPLASRLRCSGSPGHRSMEYPIGRRDPPIPTGS